MSEFIWTAELARKCRVQQKFWDGCGMCNAVMRTCTDVSPHNPSAYDAWYRQWGKYMSSKLNEALALIGEQPVSPHNYLAYIPLPHQPGGQRARIALWDRIIEALEEREKKENVK